VPEFPDSSRPAQFKEWRHLFDCCSEEKDSAERAFQRDLEHSQPRQSLAFDQAVHHGRTEEEESVRQQEKEPQLPKSSLKTSKSVLKFGNTSLLYQSSHKYTTKKDVKDKAYFLRKEAKMNENSSPCFQISSPNVYS